MCLVLLSIDFFDCFLGIFTLAEIFAWGGSRGGGGIRGLGTKSGNLQRSPYTGLGNANGDSGYNQPAGMYFMLTFYFHKVC